MAQPAVKVLDVAIDERNLEPRTFYVPGNEPVQFVVHNRTARRYEFVIPQANYQIADILPGQTKEATFTFVNVGTFDVICRCAEGAQYNFTGQLIVQVLY